MTLCKRYCELQYVRTNATRHRQFRNMLMMDDEAINVDLPYHSKVCWLSQGQVLVKILSLHEHIIDCFNGNNEYCELSDANFHRDVVLVCDVMSKQNEQNFSLQGRNKSIYDKWQKILGYLERSYFSSLFLLSQNFQRNSFPRLRK